MILESLSLFNFGLYRGLHKFDLGSELAADKPIILIKGHNGAGKTTFLEAVRVALYGKRALGPRVSQSDYEAYLMRRINNTASERHAQITLTFSSRYDGDNDSYCVKRAWAARGTAVVETLELTRNGEAIKDIPAEDWEHYVEEIIPTGVSQLFFFDGEKIQDIADDHANEGLVDAIRSLLGLDLIDQLRGDLALYKSRAGGASSNDYDLVAIARDLQVAQTELTLADEKAATLTTRRHQLAKISERAQLVFQQEGGGIAINKNTLSEELKAVESRYKALESALRNLVNGTAPFVLAPKLVKRFVKQVEKKSGCLTGPAVKGFLGAFEKAQRAQGKLLKPWTKEQIEALIDFAERQASLSDTVDLGAEPDWIVEQLSNLSTDQNEASNIGHELVAVLNKRTQLREQIKNYQPGVAAEAFENLRKSEFDMGGVDTELKQTKTEVDRLRVLVAKLKAERQRAIEAQFDQTNLSEKLDMATRAQAALASYEKRILQKRLDSLSTHFIEAFSGLVERKKLVRDVQIDPQTFAIHLIDYDGKKVETNSLSAGERQLFAVAMLWGLGKTSGRELPMIIDTPLSRLDKLHRHRLVGRYLPKASRQVIMLCTDTELTEDLSHLLQPFVCKYYEIGVQRWGRESVISNRAAIEGEKPKDFVDAHN